MPEISGEKFTRELDAKVPAAQRPGNEAAPPTGAPQDEPLLADEQEAEEYDPSRDPDFYGGATPPASDQEQGIERP